MLDSQRIDTWVRMDGSEESEYILSLGEQQDDLDELREAAQAGMRITLSFEENDTARTSLAFLEPVIDEIRDLWIGTSNRIIDAGVLAHATNLRSLTLHVGPCDEVLGLASLPRLEHFEGKVTRAVASVMRNPGLRFLEIIGAIPKSFARAAGPVENFRQHGGRSQTALPVFENPAAMRSILRVGPERFDLAQLREMSHLQEFRLGACPEVVGLRELGFLPELELIYFNEVGTPEPWEDLPDVPRGFLFAVSPPPSRTFLAEKQAIGWALPSDSDMDAGARILLEESEGSYGVFLGQFGDLDAAVDQFDGGLADGYYGELFLLGVVAELRAAGAHLDPEPDSENSMTAVYFQTQAQAEQVATRAQAVLDGGDIAALVGYLRAGAAEDR